MDQSPDLVDEPVDLRIPGIAVLHTIGSIDRLFDLAERFAPKFRHLFIHIFHIGRTVPFSPKGHRGKIGRIGFKNHPVKRYLSCNPGHS